MAEDLGISDRRGADGAERPTFREAYASWRLEYVAEYWPFLPRAIKAWGLIKTWLEANFPTVRQTIQAGISEAEVAQAEAVLGFKLPPAIKVLYRLQNGQSLALDNALYRHEAARAAARERVAAARAALEAAAAARSAARHGNGDAAAVAAAADAYDAATAEMAAANAAAEAAAAPSEAETEEELASIFHGMMGGYAVYDHLVSTRLMPLQRAAARTRMMELHRLSLGAARPGPRAVQPGQPPQPQPPQQLLAVACSFRVQDKLFVADACSGGVSVVRRGPRGPVLQPAAPPSAEAGQGQGQGQDHGQRDGMLRWFEEYARRLAGGCYEVAPLDEDDLPGGSRAISLFPLLPPAMTEAVTRGVRVRASVVYVPEQVPGGKHLFAYSIRIKLLEPASAAAGGWAPLLGAPLLRCQLVSRHWVIRDAQGRVVDEVRGEGVIGKYPVLEPGGEEFVYCSCTHQMEPRGSMEGEFRFVEGTIERPTGPSFDVVCPLFRLDVPDFVY